MKKCFLLVFVLVAVWGNVAVFAASGSPNSVTSQGPLDLALLKEWIDGEKQACENASLVAPQGEGENNFARAKAQGTKCHYFQFMDMAGEQLPVYMYWELAEDEIKIYGEFSWATWAGDKRLAYEEQWKMNAVSAAEYQTMSANLDRLASWVEDALWLGFGEVNGEGVCIYIAR